MLFLLCNEELIGIVDITHNLSTVTFLSLDQSITHIEHFETGKINFAKTIDMVSQGTSTLSQKQISAHFESLSALLITAIYENGTTSKFNIEVFIRTLFYGESLIDVVDVFLTSIGSTNTIEIKFPANANLTGSVFMAGQALKKVHNSLLFTCPESFITENPISCSKRMKGVKEALENSKTVEVYSPSVSGPVQTTIYSFQGVLGELDAEIVIPEDENKWSVTQIIMVVILCLAVVSIVVMPIICLKSNSRSAPINKAIASGYGGQRKIPETYGSNFPGTVEVSQEKQDKERQEKQAV